MNQRAAPSEKRSSQRESLKSKANFARSRKTLSGCDPRRMDRGVDRRDVLILHGFRDEHLHFLRGHHRRAPMRNVARRLVSFRIFHRHGMSVGDLHWAHSMGLGHCSQSHQRAFE